jgi:hypothetical protein
MRLD